MEPTPIRIGIVGCGGLAQAVYIPCLAADEAFRVVLDHIVHLADATRFLMGDV